MPNVATMQPQSAGGAIPADPNATVAASAGAGPFPRAAREHIEPFFDVSQIIGAGTVALPPQDVPAYGYFRSILLLVTTTLGVGAGVVAFEDSPYAAIQSLTLNDVNGAPFVGPLAGHDLYLINKYGGYNFLSDPATSPAFSAVGASGGNFSFLLRVPVEITGRDALGALPNQNAASTYKLNITLNSSAGIYTTPPGTTLPTVRFRGWLEAWTQPNPTDLRGMAQATTPPNLGTTQFWSKFVRNITAGQQTIQFPRVGNYLRNLVLVFRNSTPVRNDTNFPDPAQIFWDGRLIDNIGQLVWKHYNSERFGYPGVSGAYAAQELDTGVFVKDFTHDLDGKAGFEQRDLYWPTTSATRLELQGSFGAAGTLTVLTNDVAPYGGDVYVA